MYDRTKFVKYKRNVLQYSDCENLPSKQGLRVYNFTCDFGLKFRKGAKNVASTFDSVSAIEGPAKVKSLSIVEVFDISD